MTTTRLTITETYFVD